jgi:hypothetical protein
LIRFPSTQVLLLVRGLAGGERIRIAPGVIGVVGAVVTIVPIRIVVVVVIVVITPAVS